MGSGMHTNMSLFRNGKNAFYDPDDPKRPVQRGIFSFIAGLLHHVKGMAAVTNPWSTPTSGWCPATRPPATWPGRPPTAPPSSASPPAGARAPGWSCAPDPSCNPYLAFAVCPGRRPGRHREGHDAPAEVTENIFDMDAAARKAHGIDSLPDSLEEASAPWRPTS